MQVRGPRIRPLVVRVERRWQPALALASLVSALLIAGFIGYFFGRDGVLDAFAEAASDAGLDRDANPRELVAALIASNAGMRDELAVQRGSRDMSREVEEQVRQQNRRLQDDLVALERAVAWYRKLSVADRDGAGLRIEQLSVLPAADGQPPVLRLLLVRTGDTDGTYAGRLGGTLLLRGASGLRQVALESLLPAGLADFRVRYVDELRLPLAVPAGAGIARVDLVAEVDSPQAARITRTWQRP